MKIEVTRVQLQAIASMANDLEAMIGGCAEAGEVFEDSPDTDKEWARYIAAVDRMFKKNGLQR